MGKSEQIYYVIDVKGSLVFTDILKINNQDKTATLINDAVPAATFGVTEIKQSRFSFNRRLAKLVRQGYAIKEEDGAKDRIPAEEALKALNLCFTKEKLAIYSTLRAQVYPYFDIKIFEKAVNAYLDNRVLDLYINFWAIFYSHCLEESYHQDNTDTLTKAFIEKVCLELEDFSLVLSQKETAEGKKKTIKTSYLQIKQAYNLYEKQRSLSLAKKQRAKKQAPLKSSTEKKGETYAQSSIF